MADRAKGKHSSIDGGYTGHQLADGRSPSFRSSRVQTEFTHSKLRGVSGRRPYTIRPPLTQRKATMPKRITRKRSAEVVAEIREKANRKEERLRRDGVEAAEVTGTKKWFQPG
jgi:hypothetical protein